jgi:hypothetical protein
MEAYAILKAIGQDEPWSQFYGVIQSVDLMQLRPVEVGVLIRMVAKPTRTGVLPEHPAPWIDVRLAMRDGVFTPIWAEWHAERRDVGARDCTRRWPSNEKA